MSPDDQSMAIGGIVDSTPTADGAGSRRGGVLIERHCDYIVYGAGGLGRRVREWIQRQGGRVVAFADRDVAKQAAGVDALPVLAPTDLPAWRGRVQRIVTATMYVESAVETLCGLGLKPDADFLVVRESDLRPAEPMSSDQAKLLSLRNRHANQIGFLIGNGPSVRLPDLERLNDRVTFCCNRFHLAYGGVKFRPTYTVSSDPQMIEDFGAEMVAKSAGTVILASKTHPAVPGDYLWVRLKVERPMTFSPNPLDHVAPGGATLVAAMQLGYFMGIRRFYLYGVDHSFKFEKVAEAELARSAKGDGNHFIKDYRSGRAWYPPAMQQIEESYRICDRYLRARGGWLKNASRVTQLPDIERSSFDEIWAEMPPPAPVKPKILIISPVMTHPPFGGDKQRIAATADALRAQGNDVYFLFEPFRPENPTPECLAYWGDRFIHGSSEADRQSPPTRDREDREGTGTETGPKPPANGRQNLPLDHWYPASLDRVLAGVRQRHEFAAVIVEYVVYSKALASFPPGTRRVIDTLDRFSDRCEALRGYTTDTLPWPWREISVSPGDEARGLQRADVAIAIQSDEARFFRSLGAKEVVEVGHLLGAIRKPSRRPLRNRLLFVGSGWQPNQEGVRWFIDHVLPGLREQIPTLTLHVAGRVSTHLQSKEGVVLEGLVEDLTQSYREADIVINPVTRGTGQAIKSVEALSHGLPLVTFPNGARGIDEATGKGLLIVDSAEDFTETILRLLRDGDEWLAHAEAAAVCAETIERRNLQNLARVFADLPPPTIVGAQQLDTR